MISNAVYDWNKSLVGFEIIENNYFNKKKNYTTYGNLDITYTYSCTLHAYTLLYVWAPVLLPIFCSCSFSFVRMHNRHNKQTERCIICAHAIIPTEQCCYTCIWETQIVQSRYTKLRHNSYGILQYEATVKNSAVAIVRSKT